MENSSSCAGQFGPGEFHSIQNHEMLLMSQQNDSMTGSLGSSSVAKGFPTEHTQPKQHTVTFAVSTSSPQPPAGQGLQHSISQRQNGINSTSPQPMAYSRSNPDLYHADVNTDLARVLGLRQASRPAVVDPARLAEQNLAKGAAIARIMDAKSSFSSTRSAKSAGPSSPRPGGSPPFSPRGVAITEGIVGNSMRHLQPWQLPQAQAVLTGHSFSSNSSKSPMLYSAPLPAVSKASMLHSSSVDKSQQSSPQQLAAVPVVLPLQATPWPLTPRIDAAADAASAATAASPPHTAGHQHATVSMTPVVPAVTSQDECEAPSSPKHAAVVSKEVSSKAVLVPAAHAVARPAVPECKSSPAAVAKTASPQHTQQLQHQPHASSNPIRKLQAAPKKNGGGLFACCFAGSATADDADDQEPAAADAFSPAGAMPALLGTVEPRSSEVWGLAKDKASSQGGQGQANPADDAYLIRAYCTGLAEPQPVQQAFDFHTGTASGPYVGLTAEPLKLESSSVGGVDSRVSSVGGAAAYNPPGAYNPGAAGACGSTGGAPGLRRMSSSRKFSRQGSRMRQSADTVLEVIGQAAPAQAIPEEGAFHFSNSATGGSAAAAVASWVTGDGAASPALARAVSEAQAAAERQWTARRTADTVWPAGTAKQVLFSAPVGASPKKDSPPAKAAFWPGLQQQLAAKQTQHQQILQKQKQTEEKLMQQQEQLEQQLEALRQLRSRTPSPNKGHSPKVSPRNWVPSSVAAAAPALTTTTGRAGRSPTSKAAKAAGSKGSARSSPADIASTMVALDDLMNSNSGRSSSRASKADSSGHATPAKARGSDATSALPQTAASAARAASASGEQLRAAAETLLKSLDGGGGSMDPETISRLLAAVGAAPAAVNEAAGSPSSSISASGKSPDRSRSGSSAATAAAKKPFVLQIPGVNSPPMSKAAAPEASNAFRFSTASNNAQSTITSEFKVPKGLLSLSFKRKKAGTQRVPHKTVRAWYRPISLSPKSPVVKYSSFKVAASLMSPKLLSPQSSAPRALVLLSPSTRFNSRRIKAGMFKAGVESLQGSDGAVGSAAAAAQEALWRIPRCSSVGSVVQAQNSFAVTGECFADAADEETAGTAAAELADSLSGHVTPGGVSSISAATSRGCSITSARAGQQHSRGHASRPVSGSPAKQQAKAGSSGTGTVQPRRTTSDAAGESSKLQIQQQRARATSTGPRQLQGSYAAAAAAAAGSTRRSTTSSEAASKSSQLHMMSTNSYLRFLKQGSGSDAAASDAAAATVAAAALPAAVAASIMTAPAGPAAVPQPAGHLTHVCQPGSIHVEQHEQWVPSPKQPSPAAAAGWQRQRSFQGPHELSGYPSPGTAAAEAAAAEAVNEIAARALRAMMVKAAAAGGSGDGAVGLGGDRLIAASGVLSQAVGAYLGQQKSGIAASIGAGYSADSVASASSGVSTHSAVVARAAAAAAVQAVAAAADARAAEAKAAAEAAMLMGAPLGGLSSTDESSFGDGFEECYAQKQHLMNEQGSYALCWQQARAEEQRRQVAKQEEVAQKQVIEQQMAVLQQQLQHLQQQRSGGL